MDLRGRFCVKLIRIGLGGRRDIKLVGIGGELRWERFGDEEKYWESMVGLEKIRVKGYFSERVGVGLFISYLCKIMRFVVICFVVCVKMMMLLA